MSVKKKTRKKPTPKNRSNKKIIYIFLLILLFAFLSTTISYFVLSNQNSNKNITTKTEPIKKVEPKKEVSQEIKEFEEKLNEELPHDKFEEITEEFKKDIIENKIETKEETPDTQDTQEPKEEIKHEQTIKKPEVKKPVVEKVETTKPKYDEKTIITDKDLYKYNKKSKAKLAIIIDDVTTSEQKNRILNVGYKVNMAFLPPTQAHQNSAKIAQDLPFGLIHFPMQASPKFKGPESNTLNITDSYETIEKRVAQLRAWYPKIRYTNNHTGSVFTENDEAMDKLFKALKKHNFIFVDSRTSAKSVAKKYANKYGMPYIVRNTFLDNEKDFNYIQNQLSKAIAIAKNKGFAIAIGHPYPITTEVLSKSKHLLKDVELIYVNQLPYLK